MDKEIGTKPRAQAITMRVSKFEKMIIFQVFGSTTNLRKFLMEALQDPEIRKRIEEIRSQNPAKPIDHLKGLGER